MVTIAGISGHVAGTPSVTFTGTSVTIPESPVTLDRNTHYGHARLEAACARALAHDSPYYRTVKSILSTGADKAALVEPITPPAYAKPRFARDAATLFASPNPQLDLLH